MPNHRFLFFLAVIVALPAHAGRESDLLGGCPLLTALWSQPAPAALPYEFILDRPIEWHHEAPADDTARRLLSVSSAHWRSHVGGVGSAEHQSHVVRMAGHWVRRSRGYLVARRDWGFAERAEALERFCAIIQARTKMPPGTPSLWRLAIHRSKEGDLVVTGEKHRIVLLNVPGAPLVAGRVPFRERQWIARAGGPERYYRSWILRDWASANLHPVSEEPLWEELTPPNVADEPTR